MAYQRKTKDAWEIYGDYGDGWEYVDGSNNRAETRENLKQYRFNAPQYQYYMKKVREPLTA